MKSSARWMLSICGTLLFGLCAQAQERGGEPGPVLVVQQGMPGIEPGPVAFGGQVELLGFGGLRGGKVVKGAPFAAVAIGETKQTLADGTTITHKFQSNLYRDAEGRFRKESTLPAIGPLASSGKSHSFIVIMDPVAGTTYALDPDQKVAHKLPERKGGPEKFSQEFDMRFEHGPGGILRHEKIGADSDANEKKESLGTQTINGVSAEGTRYTRIIPVGQIGNDRALTVVKEEWYSPDLQTVVQSKRTDPMFGQTVYSLTNIQRTAPNANLFSVPSDFTIKEGSTMGMVRKRDRMRKGDGPPPSPGGPGPGM
jgi:hypothetical protein